MKEVKKLRKLFAMLLVIAMLTQNAFSVLAGITTEELDRRAGNTQQTQMEQSQLDQRSGYTEQNDSAPDEAMAGDQQTDQPDGDSGLDEGLTDGDGDGDNDQSQPESVPANVSAQITQSIYQDNGANFVQLRALVTNNDAEHTAEGVSIKALLPELMSYVNVGAETGGISTFNYPAEVSNYTSQNPDFNLNEVSGDVINAHANAQVIMWIAQNIAPGAAAEYTFTARIADGVTDTSALNTAWYVNGTASSYNWENAELLAPPSQEETPAPEEPENPENPENPEPTPETPDAEITGTPNGTDEEVTPTPEETEKPEDPDGDDVEVFEKPEDSNADSKIDQDRMNKLVKQRKMLKGAEDPADGNNGLVALDGEADPDKDIEKIAKKIETVLKINGKTVNPPYDSLVINRNDSISLEIQYDYSNDKKPTEDDCSGFYLNLPFSEKLLITTRVTGNIYDLVGTTAGQYEIKNGKVFFNYNQGWISKHPEDISGTFKLTLTVDKEGMAGDDEIIVHFPGLSGDLTIQLGESDLNGEKTYLTDENGKVLLDENGYMTFQIKLKPDSANVQNVIVKDTLTGSVEFVEGSFQLLTNGENSQDISGNAVISGKTVTITVGNLDYGNEYYIQYKVRLSSDAEGNYNVSNKAEWTWEGNNTGKNSTTNIDLSNKVLNKSGSFIQDDNIIEYTIFVNELEQNLLPDGDVLTLTDELPTNVTFLSGTCKITGKNGETLGGYSYDTQKRKLTFTIPDKTYAKITYSVKVEGKKGDTLTITNKVDLEGRYTSSDENVVKIQDSTATITGRKGTITITKQGQYSTAEGELPFLKDVRFALYKVDLAFDPVDLNGSLVVEKATNTSGQITFGDGSGTVTDGTDSKLEKNILYYIVETQTVDPYILDTTKRYFVIQSTDTPEEIANNNAFNQIVAEKCGSIQIAVCEDGEYWQPIMNDKIPQPTTTQFTVQKTVSGVEGDLSGFKFKVEGTNGTATPTNNEATSAANGTATFTPITFDTANTYHYKISEIEGSGSYLYDKTVYDVDVVVERDGHGDLYVKNTTYKKGNTPVSSMTFENKKSTELTLKKVVTEKAKANTGFTFEVTGENVDFSLVTVTGGEKIGNDKNKLTVKVTVNKDAKESPTVTLGKLPIGATVSISEDLPSGWSVVTPEKGTTSVSLNEDKTENQVIFTNKYESNGSWTPSGKKIMEGRPLNSADNFKFVVQETTEEGSVIGTVSEGTVTGTGEEYNKKIDFEQIQYTKPGVHYYIISETPGTETGMGYSSAQWKVTVNVEDDGQGKLTATHGDYQLTVNGKTEIKDQAEFTNTYTASGSWTPKGTKTLTGTEYKGTVFNFIVMEKIEGESDKKIATGTADKDGDISFESISYEAKDIGTHTYEISEVPGDREDVKYDNTTYTVEVNVEDKGNGVLEAEAGSYKATDKQDSNKAAFENKYTDNASWTPVAKKEFINYDKDDNKISDRPIPNGSFTFKVVNDVKEDEFRTGTAGTDGNVTFTPAFSYTQDDFNKTFNYTISEIPGEASGVEYDTQEYKVTVTIGKDDNGRLKATPTYTKDETTVSADKVIFRNKYKASGKWTPKGDKTLTGRDFVENEEFKFKVIDISNQEVISEGTAVNGENGKPTTINFDPAEISYDLSDLDGLSEKTFVYKINEAFNAEDQDKEGLHYDSSTKEVTVTISDKGDGTLKVVSNYKDSTDGVHFANSYGAKGTWTLKGIKHLERNSSFLSGVKFSYTIKDETSGGFQTVESGAEGEFEFPTYTYTKTGTHIYTITENNTGIPGIQYDETKYKVQVEVTDPNHDGNLVVEAHEIKKGSEGQDVVQTEPLTSVTFNNSYSAEGEWELSGNKLFTGREYGKNEKFHYKIEEEKTVNGISTYTEVSTGESGADGVIRFNKISYKYNDEEDDTGYHKYRIYEVPGDDKGITYSTTVFNVGVTVSDNGKGTLQVVPNLNNPEIKFTNTYSASGSWEPTGNKKLTGRQYNENETFTYKIDKVTLDENGEVISREPAREGTSKAPAEGEEVSSIDFGKRFDYTENDIGKTYYYQIYEVDGSGGKGAEEPGLEYDDTEYIISVAIEDEGNGKLKVTPTTLNGGTPTISFTNSYTADGNWSPKVKKELIGREYRDGEKFKYEVKDDNNNTVLKGSNGADGIVTFLDIDGKEGLNFTQEDINKTYHYTISEVQGTDVGTDYDASEFEVIVHVKDAGNGKLDITDEYPGAYPEYPDQVVFKNTYGALGKWIPEGTKKLVGRDYKPGETFQYYVTDMDTKEIVSHGWNVKDGSIKFTRVDYEEGDVGDHHYEISEVIPDAAGTAYDKTLYHVTVTVEDAGRGKLNATPVYENGEVKFENKAIHFHVSKVDITTEEEVAGAELTVFGKDKEGNFTKKIGSWISETGVNYDFGELLTAGQEYLLRETVAPDGYFCTRDIEFKVNEDGSIETGAKTTTDEDGNDVYLVEDTKNDIIISKKAIGGTEELNGAVLQILDENGEEIVTWTSETTPYVAGKALERGKTYTLHEVSAPDGYLIADDIHFTVNEDGTVSPVAEEDEEFVEERVITMRDAPRTVTALKTDKEGNGLAGATLQILDDKGEIVENWVSTTEAHVVEEKLKAGVEYTLRETVAPAGYKIAASQKFTLDSIENDTVALTMEDEPTSVIISKKAITGNDSLGGATLRIVEKDSQKVVVEPWTTEDGKDTTVTGVLSVNTTYTLEEVTPPAGYALADPIDFTINENGEILVADKKETMVVMRDAKTRIKVSKMDRSGEDELPGAVLQILDKADSNKVVEEWTTTGEPKYIEGLTVGKTYILHEKLAPKGYAYAPDWEFVVKANSIEGKEQWERMYDSKNVVLISKTDITGTKALPGAKLQLLDMEGKVLEEWTSTSEDYKITYKVEAGKQYILREIAAPDGYAIAEDIKFTVNEDGTPTKVVMKDDLNKLSISKTDLTGTKELAGAVLAIYDKNGKEIEKWTSDGKPHAIHGTLIGGVTYILREISAPAGYLLAKDMEFTIDKDGTAKVAGQKVNSIVMKDAPTVVKILKVDGNGKGLSGASLAIKDSAGTVIESWTSDGNAHTIEAKLELGKEYTLTETSAPSGYLVAEDMKFTVTDKEVTEVTMVDYPAHGKGSITVTKKVALIKDGEISDLITEDDTFYVNLFTDPEGQHPFKNAAPKAIHLVHSFAGSVTFDDLPTGTYYVYETDQNSKAINFEELNFHNGQEFQCIVEDGGSNSVHLNLETGAKEGVISLENCFYKIPDGYSYRAFIDINKQVLKGGSETTVDDTFYAGIFTRDDSGTYNLYQVVQLEQNGTVQVEVGLGGVDGTEPITYYVFETDADGNIVDLDVFEYEVSGEGNVTLNTSNIHGNIDIVNEIPEDQEAKLIIQKVDENSIGLAGAKFTITDADGTTVDEWTSEASAHSIVLDPGEYTLTELQAPEGYVGGDKVAIVVDDDNNITVDSSVGVTFKGNVMKYMNKKAPVTPPGTSTGGGGGSTARSNTPVTSIKAVKTGDDTPIALYVLLLAAALGAAGIVVVKRRKSSK